MSGFNLPPGCRVSDLPGAETSAEEEFFESICDILVECGVTDEQTNVICERLLPLINEALRASYNDGGADVGMAAEVTIEEFLMGRDISEVSTEDIIKTFGSSNTLVSKCLVGLARRIKMPYRVIKVTNLWDSHGRRTDVKEYFAGNAATLVEAFKYVSRIKNNPMEPVSVRFRVEDERGAEFTLLDAYRQVAGEDADENFSINLDDWIKEQ